MVLSKISWLLPAFLPLVLAIPAVLNPGCETKGFKVYNFTTIEPKASSGLPTIIAFSFYNPNPGGDLQRECYAEISSGASPVSGALHQCEGAGNYFIYPSFSELVLIQPVGCPNGDNPIYTATGDIKLKCYGYSDGGETCVNPSGEDKVPVTQTTGT